MKRCAAWAAGSGCSRSRAFWAIRSKLRARRSQAVVDRHLAALDQAARGSDNLMPPLKAALADYVTIGECCRVLRGVFGEYHPREAA